jgi:hypothetical protein
VLARAAAYVDNLHQQLSGIVAEEHYVQRRHVNERGAAFTTERRLKSDLLLVRMLPVERYVMFRDVFEVDGKPVRDREDRLTALFLQPGATNSARLMQVINEGARYNLGKTARNVNTPLVALTFLASDMQPRFRFKHLKYEPPKVTANPAAPVMKRDVFAVPESAWVVEFKEAHRPTFIKTESNRDFPASGRFWIEPIAGTVLVSQLAMENKSVNANIVVSYQSDALLGFRVPVAMDERYRAPTESVDALATYGRFRQFQVTTSETLKPSGQ